MASRVRERKRERAQPPRPAPRDAHELPLDRHLEVDAELRRGGREGREVLAQLVDLRVLLRLLKLFLHVSSRIEIEILTLTSNSKFVFVFF